MTEAEFTALYVQHRAGSPPIPWGPTTADQIRDQQKLWHQLADFEPSPTGGIKPSDPNA
jgi:hypothetical protein